jgi:NEDD8-activating enzyme E1 regulatory subunit
MLPQAKARKYDRQLRLWDLSGQEALESAHVCLLGSSALASETAKNLVLPGLGELTIVDDQLVQEEDIEANFFVPAGSVGHRRAAEVRNLLQELNSELECTFHARSPSQIIVEERDDFWFQFTLVIACGVDPAVLVQLNSVLYQKNIPLMVLETVSFYGYIRVSLKEHTIMETHPESLVDLRLDATWPALDEFVASYDLETLSSSDREHVPYVVLLLKYLQQWRRQSGKLRPETSQERSELKSLIDGGRIAGEDQENYDEAVATVWRLAKQSEVPSIIRELISSPGALVTRQSPPFWILVAALGKYLEKYLLLPISGVLPDMKADTKGYVSLQQVYRAKAQEDFQEFKKAYLWVLENVGLPDNYISEDIAELFCKHSGYLKVIYGSQLEYGRPLEVNCKCDL